MLAWTEAQLWDLDFFYAPFQLLWNLSMFLSCEAKKMAENVPPIFSEVEAVGRGTGCSAWRASGKICFAFFWSEQTFHKMCF